MPGSADHHTSTMRANSQKRGFSKCYEWGGRQDVKIFDAEKGDAADASCPDQDKAPDETGKEIAGPATEL
jgi:hypothetical protein